MLDIRIGKRQYNNVNLYIYLFQHKELENLYKN